MLQLGTKGNMNYIQTSRTQTGCSILLLGKQGTSKDHESSSCCNTPSRPSAWHPGLSQWAESDWGRAAWDAAWQGKSGPGPHNLHDITTTLLHYSTQETWLITSPWDSVFIALHKNLDSSLLLGKASQTFLCSSLNSEVKVEEAEGGSQSDKGTTRLQ